MWELLFAVLYLGSCCWLLWMAAGWWFHGSIARDISDPERHQARMAEWQQHVDEAQVQLAYYRNTPNWFDLQWPVCDRLDISDDGEYCRHCFRQVSDHAMRVAA